MHDDARQQLWLAWGQGQISDQEASAAAEQLASEAAHAASRRQEAAIARDRAAAASRAGKASGRCPTADRAQNAPAATARPARPKCFGDGCPVPLDRNAKVRLWVYARALSRRTEPGRAYGELTAKALAVLQALLWGFHNAASGRCFPSYEAIAEAAGCARSTVAEAIRMLERAGVLTWVQRIKRVREYVPGLFGKTSAWRWVVQRTSNAYVFNDPSSKSEKPPGTAVQAVSKEGFASLVPVEPTSTSKKPVEKLSGWLVLGGGGP